MQTQTSIQKPSKLGRNPLAPIQAPEKTLRKIEKIEKVATPEATAQAEAITHQSSSKLHTPKKASVRPATHRFHPVIRAILFAVASGIALREWLVEVTHS